VLIAELDPIIKLAVDIQRQILAGGGEMHADYETVLIEAGSHQKNIWGANWIPSKQTIEFEALINIRPKQQVETIVRKLLEVV
jgi:hypothetical protein